MTNITLQQISDLLDKKLEEKLEEKLDQKLEPIKQDINGLKKGQEELRQDVKGLKQGQEDLKQSIEDLAMNAQKGFVESEAKLKDMIYNQDMKLEAKIETVRKEAERHKIEIVELLDKNAYEAQDARDYQLINTGEHDTMKDNHEKLKIKVKNHETRIKVLEPALA